MLDVFIVLPSFPLSRSYLVSLFMAYFRPPILVTSFPSYSWCWAYGYYGIACNSTFKQPSTLSAVRLAFVYFVDQGHRPKERFFVLVLLGV